jgi:hypothetical protein
MSNEKGDVLTQFGLDAIDLRWKILLPAGNG